MTPANGEHLCMMFEDCTPGCSKFNRSHRFCPSERPKTAAALAGIGCLLSIPLPLTLFGVHQGWPLQPVDRKDEAVWKQYAS